MNKDKIKELKDWVVIVEKELKVSKFAQTDSWFLKELNILFDWYKMLVRMDEKDEQNRNNTPND